MKRSRIICSIITVIYILLSVALILLLLKSNIDIKSSVPMYLKAIYVVAIGVCILMYVWLKTRLAKKMSNKSLSITISKIYYYLYLAVIVFVSRFLMACIFNNYEINNNLHGFSYGLGSYLNYGFGTVINNQMYANAIINGVLAFLACIVIKKIMLNITENDTVATVASIAHILIPQSLVYVNEYIKYSYNLLVFVIGILVYLKIIDEVKQFNKKSNKYLIYSVILGLIQALHIVLGGSYVLWLAIMGITTLVAMYIDIVHIRINFKNKLNYKLKILVERLEKINISKLVYVTFVTLSISGIANIIYSILANVNNYIAFDVSNSINVLMHSRNYYLVLIICSLVFEIIGLILKRKLDIKMFMVKVCMIVSGILTFFMVYGTHASVTFDTLLILTAIVNVCNICYNREEKIKLLKDKNLKY